jgi:hypothetical protein
MRYRTAYGFFLGDRWHPFLDGDDPRDLAAREAFFRYLRGVGFSGTSSPVLAAKLVRLAVRHPRAVVVALLRHRPAGELMHRGVTSDDPRLRATQERLAACHYAMGHPETGSLVPACVRHSVLDPAENTALRKLLPLVEVRRDGRSRPQ